jgi:hypothetical protein
MPVEIEPAELAQLIDFAERPRMQEWSMRAALVRYAQPQPQRVSDILELVRRTEWALNKQSAVIEREGDELWSALERGTGGPDAFVIGLLRVARELDRLGDVLATWAIDRGSHDPPDAEVDEVVEAVAQQLDTLGVPDEERPPGPRDRGV